MVFDAAAGRAYVADRANDRIAVVDTATMAVAATIPTPAEPYGVALTPSKQQLLVSTIADRTLVGYDVATGREKWRTPLASEPRGIAVSPDGTRALVAYLTTGTLDEIDLLESHRAEHLAIANPASPRRCRRCGNDGDSFARGAFTVAFMGEHLAVAPFQREVPVQNNEGAERTGSYGGGADAPITHQLAFFRFDGHGGSTAQRTEQTTAGIAQHQPRAVAWDQAHDALYVAGLGTDSILQIKNASQVSIAIGVTAGVGSGTAMLLVGEGPGQPPSMTNKPIDRIALRIAVPPADECALRRLDVTVSRIGSEGKPLALRCRGRSSTPHTESRTWTDGRYSQYPARQPGNDDHGSA
jgi:YVTN family beta-propeller protein